MPISICPNAIAWGDAATWATAALTLAGSVAVFYLGWQAQKLATSQASEAAESRKREAFVILRLIGPDVVAMLPKVSALADSLNAGFTNEEFLRIPRLREIIADGFSEIDLPVIQSQLGRLHVLEPHYAEAAAHAVACLIVLKQVSKTCLSEPRTLDFQPHYDNRNIATLKLMRTEVAILLGSLQLLQKADLLQMQKNHEPK